jgi:hypothetical protein
MTQKIKSITIKKDFPTNKWDVGTRVAWDHICYLFSRNVTGIEGEEKTLEEMKYYPDFFEIEYEKPTLLKRPDGSLISEPEDGADIVRIAYIDNNIVVEKTTYKKEADLSSLKFGLVFLPEDTYLAEKKAKMLTKQLEIQYEIDILNAEEGWVADWGTGQDKFHFKVICRNIETGWEEVIYTNESEEEGYTVMSKVTAQTILAKYSQDELKQYLGIII